jgi:predicted dehydrogenase
LPIEHPIRLGVVGCGHIATEQASAWAAASKILVTAGLEPNTEQFERFAAGFTQRPRRAETLADLLDGTLDAIYIATPHAFHAEQAIAALDAGLDVLLEKPMAYTLRDARAIEAAAASSRKTLVVAFNGSLAPNIRAASAALQAGTYGRVKTISGTVSENWAHIYSNHWKQNVKLSGGGFLLDTGSHALNAVLDVAGCGFESLSARLSGNKPGIETSAVISGQMENGALVALAACGDTVAPCFGELSVFCENAVLRLDPWGQRPSMVRTGGGETELAAEKSRTLIDLFLDVRAGRIENPSPVERNVDFARLWQAIGLSSQKDGAPVTLSDLEMTYEDA